MALSKEQVVSAQVLLRAASGKPITGDTVITSDNIKDFAPAAEAVARASAAFAAARFEIGPAVGISFSITAPISTFEKVFKTQLRLAPGGGVEAIKADGSGSYELPLNALAAGLANLVTAVTFTPPPDFGPPSFFGP
jgi:hypothetical protein